MIQTLKLVGKVVLDVVTMVLLSLLLPLIVSLLPSEGVYYNLLNQEVLKWLGFEEKTK